MARRLGALVVTLFVLAAPVVGTVCQLTCRFHDQYAAVGGPPTHCHPTTSLPRPTIKAIPHACERPSGEDVGIEQALSLLTTPLAVPVSYSLPSSIGHVAAAVWTPHNDLEPPGILALAAQLRV